MIDDANLPAPDPRALVEELRQLLGLRSRQSLRDRTFPELFTLLADEDRATPDRRFAALTRLLDDAIAAIDDPAHRHAPPPWSARAPAGGGRSPNGAPTRPAPSGAGGTPTDANGPRARPSSTTPSTPWARP